MEKDITAARAVAEFFKSPDDLVKLSQTRKKLQREQAGIDAKLKEGAKAQVRRSYLEAIRWETSTHVRCDFSLTQREMH